MAAILKWGVVVFVLGQVLLSPTVEAKLPDITPVALIEAVKSADSRLVSMETKHTVDERYSNAVHRAFPIPEKRKLRIHWRKQGIKHYVDGTIEGDTVFNGKPFRIVQAFDGKTRWQWTPNSNKGDIFGDYYEGAWPVPIDFGMTFFKRDKKLGESLGDCEVTTPKQEECQGHECYFVEAIQPDGAKAEVWIDPEIGWRARRIRFWGPHGSIWHEASAEFKDCGNAIWFPVEGVFKLYGNDKSSGERVVSIERRLKVEQVKVNADLTQEDFDIQFPPGTRVYDHRSNVGYVVGVTPPRLTGKPLPNMKELGVGSDPNQTKDKMLLVCFFDMNQRPSRHCITQLAKQAEQLKRKGAIIIAVQASKVDETALREWVKNNGISFPVGMVQGDEEKTMFNWGVKALPWLIVTDRERTVRAEGFGLDELDKKLKANMQE